MTYVETWFAVLERSPQYTPGCRQPDGEQCGPVYSDLDDAVAYLDGIAEHQQDRYDIYRVEPVSESARWDWQVVRPGEEPPKRVSFVSEQAARSCRLPGDDLVRRRRGSDGPWVVVESGSPTRTNTDGQVSR